MTIQFWIVLNAAKSGGINRLKSEPVGTGLNFELSAKFGEIAFEMRVFCLSWMNHPQIGGGSTTPRIEGYLTSEFLLVRFGDVGNGVIFSAGSEKTQLTLILRRLGRPQF